MSPVLVDTSVWVNHFRTSNPELLPLLANDLVLTHPLIRGEISCGTLPDRARTLADLAELRHVSLATVPETIDFIERQKLYGKGVGFIDFQLLASTVLTAGALLWTADNKLRALAQHLNVQHDIAG